MTPYMIWTNQYEPGICVLKPPQIPKLFRLKRAVSLLAELPADAVCEMHPEYPRDLDTADCMMASTLPIISERCKDIIESHVGISHVEFLPVRIQNHKGRLQDGQFFGMHPLDLVDCIDIQASDVKWNQITKKLISGCKALVLDESKIPEGGRMFRLDNWGHCIVVHPELEQALREAELSNLWLFPAAKYTGIE